jgi:hypothetical protein
MASINVSEDDFDAVAGAAMDAKARGDMDDARRLDKIARKINAALTGATPERRSTAWVAGCQRRAMRWQDMPSTIGE